MELKKVEYKNFDQLIRKINREFLALSKKHGRHLSTKVLKKYFDCNETLGDQTVNEIIDLLVSKKLRRVVFLLETGHFDKLGMTHVIHEIFVRNMMNDYILPTIITFRKYGMISIVNNEEELILSC
jgi:hypothetical protein